MSQQSCRSCGAELPPGARLCAVCGEEVTASGGDVGHEHAGDDVPTQYGFSDSGDDRDPAERMHTWFPAAPTSRDDPAHTNVRPVVPPDEAATNVGAALPAADAPTGWKQPLPAGSGQAPPAGQPPPQPARVRRLRFLLIGAFALLLVASMAVAYVLISRDDDVPDDAPPVASANTIDAGASVLTDPSEEWELLADDLEAGWSFADLQLLGSELPQPSVLPLGEVAIAALRSPDQSQARYLGIAADTGEVLWERDDSAYPACWPVLDDVALGCSSADGVVILDPATGEEQGALALADGAQQVVSDAETIAALVVDESGQPGVVAFDADYTERWSVAAEQGAFGSGEPPAFTLSTEVVQLDRAGLVLGFDTDTGDELYSYASTATNDVHVTADWVTSFDGTQTVVTDLDGNTVLRAEGEPWSGGDGGGAISEGRIGVGAALYDVATGGQLWASAESTVGAWAWAEDRKHVLLYDDATTVLDAGSGDTLLTVNSASQISLTDDALLGITGAGELTVWSLDDGGAAWSRDVADLATDDTAATNSGIASVAVADTGVLAVGDLGIRGYAGFAEPGGNEQADEQAGGEEYAAACDVEPDLEAVSATARNGGTRLEFETQSNCDGGHWWSADQIEVTVADGSDVLAAGVIDLSRSPRWIPDDEPGSLDIVFAFENSFATPEQIEDAIAAGDLDVEVTEPAGGRAGEVPSSPEFADDGVVEADGEVEGVDADDAALAGLERILEADADAVDGEIEGYWVPQLSSKQPGTTDDGIVYGNVDILAEHLRLRARYDGVRLVDSSDWGAFRFGDYWVTLVAETSTTPEPALAWCEAQGFSAEKCYAKELTVQGPWEDSTVQR